MVTKSKSVVKKGHKGSSVWQRVLTAEGWKRKMKVLFGKKKK